MSKLFDILVIGAGPGGYIAAIRSAQLGFSVACCEFSAYDDPSGEPRLGGTCLNAGCIPLKALVASSEAFEKVSHNLADHGITFSEASIDIGRMQKRKEDIVTKMTSGIQFLFRKNKITLLKGRASFAGRTEEGFRVTIRGKEGDEEIIARKVIVATGSKARHIPNVRVDNVTICDNEGALKFTEAPKKLGVIGAGVIGLEVGSVWRRLGAEVTVLEVMPSFLGAADENISREAAKLFLKQGLHIKLGVRIGQAKQLESGVEIAYTDDQGAEHMLECDKLIVSVGRVPNTDQLNLEAVGLQTDERGFIPVNEHCATAAPGIYAIGDVVRGPMLAHKAEDEGVMVAELLAGQKPHLDYNTMPWVIYTTPEIAWVGKTEQQLRAEGREYKSGQFPFAANGRALGLGDAEGFVKMLADAKTDEILGVHIIGANASDLIAEASLAMEFRAASEDIARTCHPHPSLSEAVREAALAIDKRALNM
ncbi:dihydrolipoyl dehydrogenase [Chlorobium sp.]|jgi:dihydrolipoamide dehydrogenase|uniref:dihydrolipoyl dehydrogenase n=1 Tax=Chlorobium sp. TaxID=1095 RepID=UPI003C425D9A|nr:dihydrolipoyl dehydrogenase [Chlorobiaceae bacterium]